MAEQHFMESDTMPKSNRNQKRGVAAVAAAVVGLGLVTPAAHAVVAHWVGPTNSNWSTSTAWQDGIIPNAQGDTAQYTTGGSMVTLQDVVGGVTVGTFKVDGTANAS